MVRYLKLYWMFVKQSTIQLTTFRLNFCMVLFSNLAFFLIQFIFMGVIYSDVNEIIGWSKYDMFFYIGTYNIIDSLWVFGPFFNLLSVPHMIKDGTLDLYLTKPVNSQFMVSLRKVDLGASLSIFAGVTMISYSLIKLGTSLTVWRILFYMFTLMNSLIIMYSVYMILTCLSFWFIKADFIDRIHGILCYFALRPLGFYSGVIRFILTFLLPYGLMITMAAKSAIKEITIKEYGIFLLIAWGFLSISIFLWKHSLRRYSSASS